MEENPRIRAKWDGGCSRDSLTPSKSAVSGKEEQHGNVDLGAGDPTEGSKHRAGEGGLWESLTGALQETRGISAMISRAVHLPEEPGSAFLLLSQE